jgi:hypothetical protein
MQVASCKLVGDSCMRTAIGQKSRLKDFMSPFLILSALQCTLSITRFVFKAPVLFNDSRKSELGLKAK